MLPFTQVDVFTDELGYGNPVAVVHDADNLTDQQMGRFANWTNLSETTFLLPATDAGADYRVRIFTTDTELPFAGHPTLGSARAWLAAGNVPKTAGQVVQECAAGLVPVRVDVGGTRLAFAAPPLIRGGKPDIDDLAWAATVLGLTPRDIVDAQWCVNGPPWIALLLRDADQVLTVRPAAEHLAAGTHLGIVGPHSSGGEVAFEVRAFVAASAGVFEDPVTGSLNAALGQWLIPAGYAPAAYLAAQGTALGRRGRVHVSAEGTNTWIGGDTVLAITGTTALAD